MRTLLAIAALALMSVPSGALRATDGDNASPARAGGLSVSAAPEFCGSQAYVLEISHYDWSYAFGGPVKRVPLSGADCRWQFDDMPEGHYVAAIRTTSADRVVAAAGGDLAGGDRLELQVASKHQHNPPTAQ